MKLDTFRRIYLFKDKQNKQTKKRWWEPLQIHPDLKLHSSHVWPFQQNFFQQTSCGGVKKSDSCTTPSRWGAAETTAVRPHLPVQDGLLPVCDGVDALQPPLPLVDQTGHVLHRLIGFTHTFVVTEASTFMYKNIHVLYAHDNKIVLQAAC